MSIGQVEGMKGYLYILQSLLNNRYYIGSTNNLERRLEEHNNGESKYTSLTRPFKLMFNQKYLTLAQARKAEHKLKKFKSRKIIEKIIFDGKITMDS